MHRFQYPTFPIQTTKGANFPNKTHFLTKRASIRDQNWSNRKAEKGYQCLQDEETAPITCRRDHFEKGSSASAVEGRQGRGGGGGGGAAAKLLLGEWRTRRRGGAAADAQQRRR